MTKTAWNDKGMLDPKFLGSWDIPEKSTIIARITGVKMELLDNFKTNKKENKLVISLAGFKPLVCNISNAKAISKALGSKFIDDWVGRFIEIGTKEIRAFGENVLAIRVKETAPKQTEKENLTPEHSKWAGAKDAIKNGLVTIEKIKTTYLLTEQNEKLLCES